MYETILYSVDERIARITLNRPDARNALSDQMIGELLDAFERARADTGVRVIVLTGAGDRAFCAGAAPLRDGEEIVAPVPPPQVFGRS
ncbi:hypothetical protein GCM10023178_47070 [Actinomadura luteofluorescens]